MANVGIDGKFVPALGIRSSVIADFGQVTSKVMYMSSTKFQSDISSLFLMALVSPAKLNLLTYYCSFHSRRSVIT